MKPPHMLISYPNIQVQKASTRMMIVIVPTAARQFSISQYEQATDDTNAWHAVKRKRRMQLVGNSRAAEQQRIAHSIKIAKISRPMARASMSGCRIMSCNSSFIYVFAIAPVVRHI